MKKYLVWKAGCVPTAGVVVKAENSLDACKQVAQERTQHSIKHGTGLHFDAIDFCARPWDEPAADAQTYEVWNPATDKPARQQGIFLVKATSRDDACAKIAARLDAEASAFTARPLKVESDTPAKPTTSHLNHWVVRDIRRLINDLVHAEIAYANKGMLIDAAEKKEVKDDLYRARKAVDDILEGLTK